MRTAKSIQEAKELLTTELLNHPFGDCFVIIIIDDYVTEEEAEQSLSADCVCVRFDIFRPDKRTSNIKKAYRHAIKDIEQSLEIRVVA